MPARSFYVHNLGCKVNRAESDLIGTALRAAGGVQASQEDAELIVINTCTVTAEAEAKTRKAIRKAALGPQAPWVIATGCAIALGQAGFEALGKRVIAEPDKLRACDRALELLGLMPASEEATRACLAQGEGLGTRRGIKVQDGCDNACSYCIVPTARGRGVSLSVEEVLAQVLDAEAAHVREIMLTGVNIGAYHHKGHDLASLVQRLLENTSDLRIRLSSLEPQHCSSDVLGLMATWHGRLCAHLHLPLQSGCDRTLRDMHRHYDVELFAQLVGTARRLMPQIALTTDLMVGFPGESDRDFEESLAFCKEMGFSKMHIFRYSLRPGTLAAQRTDQVAPEVRATRSVRMRELARQMERADAQKRVGRVEQVLVEGDGRGTSESYHRVLVDKGITKGSLIQLQFTQCRDTLLSGIPV